MDEAERQQQGGEGLYLVNITFLTGLVLTFLVAFCNKKEKLVF